MYAYIYIYIYIYVHTYLYIHTHIDTHSYVYIHSYVCVYIYIYIYARMYSIHILLCIYIYLYIQMWLAIIRPRNSENGKQWQIWNASERFNPMILHQIKMDICLLNEGFVWSLDTDFFWIWLLWCRVSDHPGVKLLWQCVDVLTARCGGELSPQIRG